MKNFKLLLIIFISLNLCFCASSQKKLEKQKEKDPQYQYKKAVIAMKYGLLDEAIRNLTRALTLDESHYQSYNLLGLAYLKKGKFEEAAQAYRKRLQFQPQSAEAHFNLGYIYEKRGSMDKAVTHYKKAFTLDKNPKASLNIAEIYFKQEKLKEALGYVRKSIQEKSSAGAYNLQGVLLNKMGKYPQAIESFKKAKEINPQNNFIKVNLGMAYFNNQDYEQARALFKKMLPQIKDSKLKDRVQKYIERLEEK
ncbi:tetratricopeptide repeat protein [bacterium]|nr:tetratricopeptide repeat protein [bacterium]